LDNSKGPESGRGYSFDELIEGQQVEIRRTLRGEDIDAFAEVSGDRNPLHLDAAVAREAGFPDRIAHGMLLAGWLSAAIGEELPGRGTVYLRQSLEFRQAALPGDELLLRLTVSEKKRRGRVLLACQISKADADSVVLRGTAEVIAPA
jgi:3-hydroxybutyryl-CoA dehydratase